MIQAPKIDHVKVDKKKPGLFPPRPTCISWKSNCGYGGVPRLTIGIDAINIQLHSCSNEETTYSLGRDRIELDHINYAVSEKEDRATTIFFANCWKG